MKQETKSINSIFHSLWVLLFLFFTIAAVAASCGGGGGGGDGDGGGAAGDTTPPTDGAIYMVQANTNISFTWSDFSDSGSGIGSYRLVFSDTSSPASCSVGTQIYSGTGTSYIHAGLTNGTTHYYRLCATDNAGNISAGIAITGTPNPTTTTFIVGQKAGGLFVTGDLAGTWNFHGITSGDSPAWNGWFHGQVISDATGNLTFTDFLDSDGITTLPTGGPFAIASDGVVTMASDPSFHGVMNSGKDMIVGTRDDGSGGYTLMIIQKAGGSFVTGDLAGTWNLHAVASGDAPAWNGWFYGQVISNASGNLTFTDFLNSDGESTLPTGGLFTIASDGIVTTTADPLFHGVMNSGKDMIIATMNAAGSGSYSLLVMQKAGGSFVTADLAGTWNFHAVASGDAPAWIGWFYGQVNTDASGNLTFTSYLDSDGITTLPNGGLLAITSGGIITEPTGPGFHGKMNLGKDLFVITSY